MELRTQVNLMGSSEQPLYSLSVGDVARHSAVVCSETTTIREAAKVVSTGRSAALFIVDRDGRAIGAVTDRDFAKKVVAEGVAADQPVTQIMTAPVVSVESSDLVFQALVKMLAAIFNTC